MKTFSKIAFLVAITLFVSIYSAKAQVTIGANQTPNANALLDLTQGATTTKGLLLPRVALTSTTAAAPLTAHVQGMVVYNTATAGDVTPGEYYNDGSKWIKLNEKTQPVWFYAPSVPLDVTTNTPKTVDIYAAYAAQFGTPAKIGGTAPSPLTTVYPASALNFYVSAYDTGAFTALAISDAGVLTYTADPANVTDATYVNIVFAVK